MKNIFYILFSVLLLWCNSLVITAQNYDIGNAYLLNSFFEKLYELEKTKKGQINIVHIGDSHVQADFFTGTIRKKLQNEFGNAGYGFTFPYSLAKTNGTGLITYQSDICWNVIKNVSPLSDLAAGLGGMTLYTADNDFNIRMSANKPYYFNTVKLIYDSNVPPFYLVSGKVKIIENQSKQVYRAKKGDTVSKVAKKYNVSVNEIRRINKLKSNWLSSGQRIKIPYKKKISTVENMDSIFMVENYPYMSVFSCDTLVSNAFIIPATNNKANLRLNGIVLENGNSGIIYHNIGVNGAKYSDYNKYDLFFKQLKCLNPDLIIVSLGTNESFGKVTSYQFISQVRKFVNGIRNADNDLPILIMTPPPSLLKRKYHNVYIQDYSKEILTLDNCASWDCLNKTGGIQAPLSSSYDKLMAKDKVHYSKDGYVWQGELFIADLFKEYNIFKTKNEF